MPDSHQIWLKQLERSDDKGIELLFKQYYIPLVLFATTYVHDREIAKDTVQDVFFNLISDHQRFASIENLKIYLYSSVKNKCLKHLRHEDVKERYQQQVQNDDEHYQNAILEEEVYSLLLQAIQNLPEQCKKVFLLTLEGKHNAEIAAILGISIETVKSHKKAGKRILYAKLKDTFSFWLLLVAISFLER